MNRKRRHEMRRLIEFSRHHKFHYPGYNRRVRRIAPDFGYLKKAAKTEDLANYVYRSMRMRKEKRVTRLRKLRKSIRGQNVPGQQP